MRVLLRTLRKVHLGIGLVLGLHFCLIATTGALYTFEPELSALARQHFVVTAGNVGPDRATEAIQAKYPEWKNDGLRFPTADFPFYSAYLIGDKEPENTFFWTDVYVDPGSGRVLGEIDNGDWNLAGLLQVAVQLHIRLCAGEAGRQFVDFSILFFVLTLIVGAVLWWPGMRRFGHGFKLRLHRNAFVADYDWHRITGILATPLLLVMACTGLLWAFPEVVKPLVYWVCLESPPSPDAAAPLESAVPANAVPVLPLSELQARAQKEFADSELTSIWIDPRPNGVAQAYLRNGTWPPPEGTTQMIVFDKYSGEVLRIEDSRTLSSAESLIEVWAHPLHYGSFGGLTTKILYALAALAVNGLYVSGVGMWWIKRRKKRAAARSKLVLSR